jgi:hypothetical protein
MNDLLEDTTNKIYNILVESFDKNESFLDHLLRESPLILLCGGQMNCENNISENISSNYLLDYYYSIEILKQFGLVECQGTEICTLSNMGEKILRKYILEKDLSTIFKAGYEYRKDTNFFKELAENTILALCKNINPIEEGRISIIPNRYFIHYFIIERLYEGLKNNTPYIIEVLAGNKKPISLSSLFLSYLDSPNWSFRGDYLIEIIEKIAGESCVNSLFAAKRRREYNISIILATMPRFVIKDRSNSVYKRYKISEEGKKFIEYILMQIYPVKYFYRN